MGFPIPVGRSRQILFYPRHRGEIHLSRLAEANHLSIKVLGIQESAEKPVEYESCAFHRDALAVNHPYHQEGAFWVLFHIGIFFFRHGYQSSYIESSEEKYRPRTSRPCTRQNGSMYWTFYLLSSVC